jgi:hypothetical protein
MGLFGRRKPDVEKLRRKGNLDGLREAMLYQDLRVDRDGVEWDLGVQVRVDAVRALAEFYGAEVAQCLADGLRDRDPEVRLAAVHGLASLGVPAATDELLDCVVRWGEPPDDVAGARALEALMSWQVEGFPEALAGQLMAARAPEPATRHRNALHALLNTDPRGPAAAGVVADRMIAMLGTLGSDGQARAERILGWIGPSAADTVLDAFARGHASAAVARAAGALRDVRAVEPLVGLLSHGDPEMRRSAAVALEGLNDTRAVPALVGATQDPEQSVRDAASSALNSMGMAAVIVGLGALMGANIELDAHRGRPPLPENTHWAEEVTTRLLRRGQ